MFILGDEEEGPDAKFMRDLQALLGKSLISNPTTLEKLGGVTKDDYGKVEGKMQELREMFINESDISKKLYFLQVAFEIVFKLPEELKEQYTVALGKSSTFI